jgi:hypothetical protein
MAGSIFVPLISVFDAKGIRDAKSGLSSIAGVVKNLKGVALAAGAAMATVGSINFVKDAVTAARDLDRNMVGLGNVFGDLTPDMQQFAKDAQSIGLSQVEAARASTFLGSVLKQSGFEMSTVAGETKNLVGLASDLAATYGYDVSEALTGMTALFRGEYDPIEKFGVAMKQAEVNALLAARGQNKLEGASLRNAQAQARLDILYQRSTDAQGAYAQQSGTLFTEQKNLAAAFNNLKASLGATLTQPLANLLTSMMPVIDALGKSLAPAFALLSKVIVALTPVVQPAIDAFLVLVDALMPIIEVLIQLITPLLIPLAGIFKLVGTVVKPLIPLITFLANVFGAVLGPAIAIVTVLLNMIIDGLSFLFNLGGVPGAVEATNSMNDALKDYNERVSLSLVATDGLTGSVSSMTSQLSKKLPVTNIDGVGNAADDATKKVKETTQSINQLVQNAKSIQSSLLSAFDITNVFDDTADGIVESVVFLNGKFKTVVTGVKNTSKDMVSGFRDNLMKLTTFSKNLDSLIAARLDPELLSQIASAGPDAGNATAEAILASGAEGVKGLNKTYTDIKKVSGDIGAKIAKSMKDSGSAMGNGLIDALTSQQEALNAAATTVGTGMGTAMGNATAEEYKKITKSLKGTAAGDFVDFLKGKVDDKKKPETEKPKKDAKPKFADMSELFKPRTSGPLAPIGKPRKEGMFSFAPGAIKNPFTAPGQALDYLSFEKAREKAVTYNLTVNVPYGATDAEIGRTLIKQIQAAEKTQGYTWRKGN